MPVPSVVYLYVEGGPQDGEEFVCGPYEAYEEAAAEAEILSKYGSATVLGLAHNSGDVLTELA